MPSIPASATIRIHGSEISTDNEMFSPYVETTMIIATVIALLAAAWSVMTPSRDADMMINTSTTMPSVIQNVNLAGNASTRSLVHKSPYAPLGSVRS